MTKDNRYRDSAQLARRASLGFLSAVGVGSLLPYGIRSALAVDAVPFYSHADFMLASMRGWSLPRLDGFTQAGQRLLQSLQADANRSKPTASREAWQAMLVQWVELTAITTGPLISRRSLLAMDFQPPRLRLIQQAQSLQADQANPLGLDQLEQIGTPAKGLPSLEWLLWQHQGLTWSAQTALYAQAITQELLHLAKLLQQDWRELIQTVQAGPATPDDPDPATERFSEFLNQYVGSIEKLRWTSLEKPLRAAAGSHGQFKRTQSGPSFPRAVSQSTKLEWQAHWGTLRTFTLRSAGKTPSRQTPSEPLSLELFLLGQGQIDLAKRLRQTALQCDRQMKGLAPNASETRLFGASKSLAALKYLVESDLSSALQVQIGFSDADGD